MGLFEQFPYTDMEKLNIWWVIDVCKRADKMLKDLPETIEHIVRPMFMQYESFIRDYYNQLSAQLNAGINKMSAENQLLQQRVNRQLAANQQLINSTIAKVDIMNTENRQLTELSISQLRNETNQLIAKYNAIWGANAAQQDAKIKKIIDDFSRKYDLLISQTESDIDVLRVYVHNQITAMQNELRSTENNLHIQMSETVKQCNVISDYTLAKLSELGDQIIAEVLKDKTNLTELYNNIQNMFDTYYQFLDMRFVRKADKTWVESEIERLEALITKMKDDILVINPVTSKQDTLQNTLNDLYLKNNPLQLTAAEYDALDLRARDYDKTAMEGMTAQEYDDRGKWWLIMQKGIIDIANQYTDSAVDSLKNELVPWITGIEQENNDRWDYLLKCCKDVNIILQNELFMSSPFDGHRKPLKDIILQMFSWIQTDTLTAAEYDGKELTSDDYSALSITAFDYDWHGASIIH